MPAAGIRSLFSWYCRNAFVLSTDPSSDDITRKNTPLEISQERRTHHGLLQSFHFSTSHPLVFKSAVNLEEIMG